MKVGDPIILELLLSDGNPLMFPRAYLFNDDTNAPISGSPFNMVYVGDGTYQYKSPTLTFPTNTFQIRAIYKVYSDPLYTTLSLYPLSMDIFQYTSTVNNEITMLKKQEELLAMELNNGRKSAINIEINN